MAHDEHLARRICAQLQEIPGFAEKRMFGGVCFMIDGNMACGVHRDRLIVRLGPECAEETLKQPSVRPSDLTGRPMKGWVQQGVAFTQSLPAKGKG